MNPFINSENNLIKFSMEELVCLHTLGYYVKDILSAKNTNPKTLAYIQYSEEQSIESLKRAVSMSKTNIEKATRILNNQTQTGIVSIPYYASDYPQLLMDLKDTPLLIHALGNKDLLYEEKTIAIIGARRADHIGCNAAFHLAQKYATNNHVIISGLALGCDTAAHLGCLSVKGKTIAIVGSGLDITHPKENRYLQEKILDSGGLLLSEQPLGARATPTRLVARNRLQAALAKQVIVAQCPIKSGTMYTVQFAREIKRDVFAVKYNHYNELSSGNEYLIREHIGKPIN